MAYSNSPLVSVTKISPNKNSPRNHAIDTITVHCFVGQVSVERGLSIDKFTKYDPKNGGSCNYVIGTDGRIGLCVEEKDRSWCSSSRENDHRAITIECASDSTYPYAFNQPVWDSCVRLVADICERNGIKKLIWSSSKSDRVNHRNGVNMTCHRDFTDTKSCPGDWFYKREQEFANEVNSLIEKHNGATTPPAQSDTPAPAQNPPPFQYVDSTGLIVNCLDLKEWDIWFAAGAAYNTWPKPIKTARAFCLEQKADLAWNLALFKFSDHRTVNFVRAKGLQDIGYGGTGETLQISWSDQCAGYAVAVRNGKVVPHSKTNSYLGGTSYRNAIGITEDGRIIIAQSTKKMTESVFASKVNVFVPRAYKSKIKLLLFEDGGGSVQEYSSRSKLNFLNNRMVATVTCAKYKGAPKITRELVQGYKGEDVRFLQTILGGVPCDGSFGSQTRSRLKAAQKALGLKQTGKLDEATRKALGV